VADCSAELKSASTPGKIQFESWKSVILPQSMPVIDNVASILKRCPDLKIQVSGHTDNTGQKSLNKALSFRRAAAVVSSLTKAGIEKSRLKSEGFGAARPIGKNETSAGRAANRRIEFTVLQ
jgi:OmpA-OmpF porin, OOP family